MKSKARARAKTTRTRRRLSRHLVKLIPFKYRNGKDKVLIYNKYNKDKKFIGQGLASVNYLGEIIYDNVVIKSNCNNEELFGIKLVKSPPTTFIKKVSKKLKCPIKGCNGYRDVEFNKSRGTSS